MCVLTMLKISENNGSEEIAAVTPTPVDISSMVKSNAVVTELQQSCTISLR